MQFLDNILNGIKGILPQGQQTNTVNPQAANEIIAGANTTQQTAGIQPQTKSQNPIVAGVNATRQIAPQQNTNNVTGFAKLNPQNWDDATRQKVLMASAFLSGFGSTPYNSNAGFWGNLSNGFASGNNAMTNQMSNYNNYLQTKSLYDQYGLDSSQLSPAGNYSSFNPLEMVKIGIQDKKNQITKEIAAEKDKTQKSKLIINAYNNGILSADDAIAQLKINGIDINTLRESNDTKETSSKINLNNAKTEDIKNPKPRTIIHQSNKNQQVPDYATDLSEFATIAQSGNKNKTNYARNMFIKRHGFDPYTKYKGE